MPSLRQDAALAAGSAPALSSPVPSGGGVVRERSLKMGSNLLFTCILLPFIGTISLFFVQETRKALDVALGFSLLTFLSSIFL